MKNKNDNKSENLLRSGIENVYRPKGPFKIISGTEYTGPRKLAVQVNNKIFAKDSFARGKEIHEVHPVKLNGSPDDLSNKVYLTKSEHQRFNAWWKKVINEHSGYTI